MKWLWVTVPEAEKEHIWALAETAPSVKIGTIQRRIAWPLYKGDTQQDHEALGFLMIELMPDMVRIGTQSTGQTSCIVLGTKTHPVQSAQIQKWLRRPSSPSWSNYASTNRNHSAKTPSMAADLSSGKCKGTKCCQCVKIRSKVAVQEPLISGNHQAGKRMPKPQYENHKRKRGVVASQRPLALEEEALLGKNIQGGRTEQCKMQRHRDY